MSVLAVYDCMLYLRAAARPLIYRPIFDLVKAGEVQVCLCEEVLREITDVLTRPEHIAKFPALTAHAVDAFLAKLVREARWISSVPEHYSLKRDPKDSKYINLALESGSEFLVTTDNDLLDLMVSELPEPREFRLHFPGIRILRPGEFEAIVRQRISDRGTSS